MRNKWIETRAPYTNCKVSGPVFDSGIGYMIVDVWINHSIKRKTYHNFLMELEIGRFLTKKEVVHHKDEDKLNNEISNLELKTRGPHIRDHFKGKPKSEEHTRKMKEKLQDPEWRKAKSEAYKGRPGYFFGKKVKN